MGLVVGSLLSLLSIVYAKCRGMFHFCQFDIHSIGNPLVTGNFLSLKSLGNKPDHHRSVVCIQSAAISLQVTDDSVFCDQQGRSKTTLEIHEDALRLVNNPKNGTPLNKEGILCMEDISHTAPSPASCFCC